MIESTFAGETRQKIEASVENAGPDDVTNYYDFTVELKSARVYT